MDTLHGVNTLQLPPSAQAVLELLEDGKPRTFKEMTKQADIAPRTIRYAIKRLKDNDLIIEKFNFRDARRVISITMTAGRNTPPLWMIRGLLPP